MCWRLGGLVVRFWLAVVGYFGVCSIVGFFSVGRGLVLGELLVFVWCDLGVLDGCVSAGRVCGLVGVGFCGCVGVV